MTNSTTPAPERVERWARALCQAASHDPDAPFGPEGYGLWQGFTPQARAAIALADEEAAARVTAPSAEALRLVGELRLAAWEAGSRSFEEQSQTIKQDIAAETTAEDVLLRYIALAEAGGAVPAKPAQRLRDGLLNVREGCGSSPVIVSRGAQTYR